MNGAEGWLPLAEPARSLVLDVAPWAALLVVALLLLARLWKAMPAASSGPGWRNLAAGESSGTVMLEFILVLPWFAIILLTTAQLAVLMNAQIVVSAAAYHACRSAIVWVPTGAEADEDSSISDFDLGGIFGDVTVNETPDEGDGQEEDEGLELSFTDTEVTPHLRAQRAAVFALMPISPSRSPLSANLVNLNVRAALDSVVVATYVSLRSAEDEGIQVTLPFQGLLTTTDVEDPATTIRFLRAEAKYLEAWGRTKVTSPAFSSPPGPTDPITVKIEYTFYLSVPYGSGLFDERSATERWLAGFLPGFLRSLSEPHVTLKSQCTLVNQGTVAGKGCS